MAKFHIHVEAAVIFLAIAVNPFRSMAEDPKESVPDAGQATVTQLHVDSVCVSMLAGLSTGPEVEIKVAGKGKHKVSHYYYRGAEINTFPEPARISLTFVGQCGQSGVPDASFVIPKFVEELRFTFCWQDEISENGCRRVTPSQMHKSRSVWQEGDMMESRSFLIPADTVKLTALLRVEIYLRDLQLAELFLRLPAANNTTRKNGRT